MFPVRGKCLEKPGSSGIARVCAVPGGLGLPRALCRCCSERGRSHSCFVTHGALPRGIIQQCIFYLTETLEASGKSSQLCVDRNALQWDANIEAGF